MIAKNDELIVTIMSQDCNGSGVAKVDGEVIFVPFAITGETVKIHIIFVKKNIKIGKIIEIIQESPDRQIPLCPYFKQCGGCNLQHIQYEKQLRIKQQMVEDTLKHVGKIDAVVDPCVASPLPWAYRNKVALPINPVTRKVSFFKSNSHTMIDVDSCKIAQPWSTDLIEVINTYLQHSQVSVYDEKTGKGLLRHVVARSVGDQLLITLVINGKTLPDQHLLIELLQKKFSSFGLNYNINQQNSNVILGKTYIPIMGPQYLKVEEFGIQYTIDNACFFQVNEDIKKAIYQKVLEYIKKEDFVIDAYSGAGLLTAMLGKVSTEVIGVEIVPEAVESANQLAKKHGLEHVKNICGDCADILPELLQGKTGAVVLDPPRKGCDPRIIKALKQAKPHTIVYISCNPSTLARDLGQLSLEYHIEKIIPFDMFPQTKHVETLAIMKEKDYGTTN